MTGNFLQIGISGLLSSQAAISTTSHNIANVNTEGYSRQTLDFTANQPDFLGGNYIGTGVITGNVTRIFDDLALLDLRSNIANFHSLDTYINQADRVDRIVADPTTGLSPAIQGFFDAVQAVADDPASTATRQAVFSNADLLIDRFKILDDQLNAQRISINNEFEAVAGQVTVLGNAIADLNQDIVTAIGKGADGSMPNDLLDQRDQLLNELSSLIKVSIVEQKDGATNVFVGNGQSLVIGINANELRASKNPEDPLNLRLELVTAGVAVPVTDDLVGGKIGGLNAYRNELLNPAINRLGLVAMGLASTINEQHNLGVDLNGLIGGNFFTDINTAIAEQNRVIASSNNLGNAAVTLTIDDVNQVDTLDYKLSYSAGTNTFTLVNDSDGTVVDSFINPGIPSSYTNASLGFTVNINSGALADNDSYLLVPTRASVNVLGRELTDLTQIAAGFPVSASSSLANTGTAEVTDVQVTDTNNASFSIAGNLNPPVRIVFTGPNTYDVVNDTTNAVIVAGTAFNPNQTNDVLAQAGLSLGYEITIGGAASTGDEFSVAYNTSGRGDNRNALAMANIQTQNILNNGSSTLQESYGLLVSEVGTRTNENKISRGAAQSLLRQNEAKVQQVSGVNLDEEAAKLIKYQQSYQAAAQIISTSNLIFDTLIASVR